MSTPEGATVDIEAIAAENAALRSQLLAENERLRAALAESQAANVQAAGLTDEDVRRLEHPEEFVQAENEEFRAMLASLQEQLHAVRAVSSGNAANATATTKTTAPPTGIAPPEQPVPVAASAVEVPVASTPDPLASISEADLQAELDRRKASAGS